MAENQQRVASAISFERMAYFVSVLDTSTARLYWSPESESFFLASRQPLTSVLLCFQNRKPETAAGIRAFAEKWENDCEQYRNDSGRREYNSDSDSYD